MCLKSGGPSTRSRYRSANFGSIMLCRSPHSTAAPTVPARTPASCVCHTSTAVAILSAPTPNVDGTLHRQLPLGFNRAPLQLINRSNRAVVVLLSRLEQPNRRAQLVCILIRPIRLSLLARTRRPATTSKSANALRVHCSARKNSRSIAPPTAQHLQLGRKLVGH